MIETQINKFPAHIFSWSKKLKTGVIDISELNARGFDFRPTPRLSLVNENTKRIKEFNFLKIDFADINNEDVAGWRYVTYINGIKWELIFIND